MKVLIIKLGALGDVVHTTVIATAIKQCYPDSEVHFLTIPSMVPLLETHPHIDKVIRWEPAYRKSLKYLLNVAAVGRKEKYDYVFNMTRALRNIMLSYLMFPKVVVGKRSFGKPWVEEYFLSAKSVLPNLKLPERLYLSVDEECKNFVTKELEQYPRPYYLLFPAGCSDSTRQGRLWGMESWLELSDKLREKGGTVFVSGAEVEVERHAILKNTIIKTGKYSLMQSLALMSLVDFVISGDSGPAHMAAALGTKTIALLGSTSPDKIKPFGDIGYEISSPHNCKFCWLKKCKYPLDKEGITPCMKAITPNMVLEKIEEINSGLDKSKI